MQTVPTIPALGSILGVWAHPDDEAFLSAGLMALARRHDSQVAVVTATLGERGTDDPGRWPPQRLAARRRAEAASSLAAVGVREHCSLGFPDGGCAAVDPDVGAAAVAAAIRHFGPDTIVTFGPDGMTGHPDHRAVSRWTTTAWQLAGRRARLWFATLTPDFHARWGQLNEAVGLWSPGPPPVTPTADLALALELDGELLDRKLAALRAHQSQTAGLIDAVGADRFRRWWATETFRAA